MPSCALAGIAHDFDRGYAHFTTRQNLQYNWIPLDKSAEVMDRLAAVHMHGIQTSGNCIRNITSDCFAGIAPDESVDPRPYAEIMRQWSTLHPEFAFLPRKFKIAVTGSPRDSSQLRNAPAITANTTSLTSQSYLARTVR
jgi:sulfite reductase (NADPH) hemoprotein beta-component